MPEHVCPVWVGYLLASPLRKLFQNPGKMLAPYVREGMTVLDIGSAMGFFSIPMAEMTGPSGKVVCADLQPKMLAVLEKRARKAGVAGRIVPHLAAGDSLNLGAYRGAVDFALASAVVHEVPSAGNLFREVFEVLKPGGVLLVAEPSGHVTAGAFAKSVAAAERAGFTVRERAEHSRSLLVVLIKEQGNTL